MLFFGFVFLMCFFSIFDRHSAMPATSSYKYAMISACVFRDLGHFMHLCFYELRLMIKRVSLLPALLGSMHMPLSNYRKSMNGGQVFSIRRNDSLYPHLMYSADTARPRIPRVLGLALPDQGYLKSSGRHCLTEDTLCPRVDTA